MCFCLFSRLRKDGDVKKLGESLKSLSSVHEENVRLQLQIATLVVLWDRCDD